MDFTPQELAALKEDASAITSLATRLSLERYGENGMRKGTPMEAALKLWPSIYDLGGVYARFANAEEWFKAAWRAKLQSNGQSARKKRTETPISVMVRNGNGKIVALYEYRRLSTIKNVLPEDDFLAEQWECKRSTVSRARSKLGVEGFAYTKCEGGWRVIARPMAQPKTVETESAPVLPALPLIESVPEPQPEVTLSDFYDKLSELVDLVRTWS